MIALLWMALILTPTATKNHSTPKIVATASVAAAKPPVANKAVSKSKHQVKNNVAPTASKNHKVGADPTYRVKNRINKTTGTNNPTILAPKYPFFHCLSITGAIFLTPTNYSNFITGFNYRFHNKPVAIIYPTSDIVVQQAVRCAVENHVQITPRSGGHSHEVLLHI
jgi:hypothetical protein